MKTESQLPYPLSQIKPEYPHLVNYSSADEPLQTSLLEIERSLEKSEMRMAQLEEQGFRPVSDEEHLTWARTIAEALR